MARPRSWDDNQLKEAFTAHTIPSRIVIALGLTNTAKNRRCIRKRLAELGLIEPDDADQGTDGSGEGDVA